MNYWVICAALMITIRLLDRETIQQCLISEPEQLFHLSKSNGSNSTKSVVSIIWNNTKGSFHGKRGKKVQRDLGDSMLAGKVSLMSSSRK